MGAVPLQVPGLAVSVEPLTALPEMVGGEVLVGGEPAPTEMLSATMANAWAAVSLPIWTELKPVAGSVAVVEWYTVAPLTATSTVPVAAPVATRWTWSCAQVLSDSFAVVVSRVPPYETKMLPDLFWRLRLASLVPDASKRLRIGTLPPFFPALWTWKSPPAVRSVWALARDSRA